MKKRIFVLTAVLVLALSGCAKKEETAETENSCSIKVSCEALVEDMDELSEPKRELVPEDGIIFFDEEVPFSEGEVAFDVIKRALDEEKIQMEYEKVAAYDSIYIEGIGNIYEKDAGDMSGWGYTVNGEYISEGLNKYVLQDKDTVELSYIVSFE